MSINLKTINIVIDEAFRDGSLCGHAKTFSRGYIWSARFSS